MFEDPVTDILILFAVVILALIFVLPGFALIRDDQVGIVTKKMTGKKLPEGKIIATKGEIGVQSKTLLPGLYWLFPIIWKIESDNVTRIAPGNIGIVESIDGKQLQSGRILSDEVVSCDSYQNATAFLDNGGYKGLQIGILKPGTYRINTKVFTIKPAPATIVKNDEVGLVSALDGIPLPTKLNIAPAPLADHKHFTDGQAFIDNHGYRGQQLETLQTGEYFINPFLFSVSKSPTVVVPPGNVAVIISSVGEELEKSADTPAPIGSNANLDQSIHEDAEQLLITDKTKRGILRDPVAPGKYNLNTAAYRAEIVPTSAVTIDWASPEGAKETLQFTEDNKGTNVNVAEFFKFGQLKVTSQDGFQLEVDVRLIIRIPAVDAPFVIARFGSVYNLIEQVAHPLIDASFRNEAGNQQALQFVHDRTKLQQMAFERAQEEFKKYHVEVQGLLIAYIKVDEALLKTQTAKQIAVQQQQQFQQEAKAQEERIAVAEKTARADQQASVIAAKLSIDINADRATALVKESEGIKTSTINKADGDAYAAREVGKGVADAYKEQVKALGESNVAFIKVMQTAADGKVVITPQISVAGNGAEGGNTIMNTFLSTLMAQKLDETKTEQKS